MRDDVSKEIVNPEERQGDCYPDFELAVANKFIAASKSGKFFTTNVKDLYNLYLLNLPKEARQHYTCHCCQRFIENYGGLVTIDNDGVIESVFWNEDMVPEFFKPSVKAMRIAVENAKVDGVFLYHGKYLGTPTTGVWTHLSVPMPIELRYKSRTKNDFQGMAEKKEDFRLLREAINSYTDGNVTNCLALLNSGSIYRADTFLPIANWFKQIRDRVAAGTNTRKMNNMIWLAVATAPEGFCHVKSNMFGQLMDNIIAGDSTDVIIRKHEDRMGTYRRSQSAPTESAKEQAEKLINQLGLAPSLERRYMRMNEIPSDAILWAPKNAKPKAATKGGIFANVATKNSKAETEEAINLPTQVMTWDKFQRTVLPTAEKLEVMTNNPSKFMALVTAVNETAENILKWNNPVSWYYHGGVDAEIRRRVQEAGGRYENNKIRCSLIWEGLTDLDLHCVTPLGEHIYFSRKRSNRCTGYLDLDMNGIDRNSDTPVENMRWADRAPEGRYKFYVHNYCEKVNGLKGTPFRVELEIEGQIYHYEGAPLRNKEQTIVFEFTYRKNQAPIIVSTVKTTSSNTSDWNVDMNKFVEVKAIVPSPNLWGDKPMTQAGNHVFFLLDGCRDLTEGKGRGFFNEMLKSDLMEIRKTLEGYTAATPIEGADTADACGIGYNNNNDWGLKIRVTSGGSTRVIEIDRFD